MMNTTPSRANRPLDRLIAFVALLTAVFVTAVSPVLALDLNMPSNARLGFDAHSGPDSYDLPIAVYDGHVVPTLQTEGDITKQTWRVEARGITTLQLLAPLRAQLKQAGYEVLLECADKACGGFDFRFSTDVLPAPDMHVDLYDYRFLSARNENHFVSLLISRTSNAGYVQIIQIAPTGAARPKVATSAPAARVSETKDTTNLPLIGQIETLGHAVLGDLAFKTGSSTLGDGPFASLAELAAYLLDDPTRKIALVGHTDTVGSLDGNIALSKRRAASVLERLSSTYGVKRTQMAAEGMGYLAPITSNLTAAGREANRRVEVILLNTK